MTTNNEAFEKWALDNKFVLENEDGIYTFSSTRFAHQTWKAATTEANKRIAELESDVEKLNNNLYHAIEHYAKNDENIARLKAKISELDGMFGKRNLHKEHEYLHRMNELQASKG